MAEGCIKTRKGSYCVMHRTRLWRTGSLELRAKPARRLPAAHGYMVVQAPGHPLAHASGSAYEHRIVLYAAIGAGRHPCCWCGRILEWTVDLHVDHLNFDRLNNAVSNLVPSCQACNTRRNRRWLNKPTHCRRGHEMTEENTYTVPATGARACRRCSRVSKAHYKAKTRRPPAPRAATPMPAECGNGHPLVGDNLNFQRRSGSDQMRWRCRECTRARAYKAYLRRRAATQASV